MNLKQIREQIMQAVAKVVDAELEKVRLAQEQVKTVKGVLNGAQFYRYIRPLYVDRNGGVNLHPTKGATLFFDLDYNTRECRVSYSICDGDLFSRETGRMLARESGIYRSITFSLPPGGFDERGIVDYFVRLAKSAPDKGDQASNISKIARMYRSVL